MVLSLAAALALIPLSCVARARVTRTPLPRIHIVPDMDNQGKFQAQQSNPLFADGRAMRPPVPGTIALGELDEDEALHRGVQGGEYVTALPVPLTETLLRRGRQRYDIFCSPCHGLAGYGDGMVARRADQLQQALWVPPASLHDAPETTR